MSITNDERAGTRQGRNTEQTEKDDSEQRWISEDENWAGEWMIPDPLCARKISIDVEVGSPFDRQLPQS